MRLRGGLVAVAMMCAACATGTTVKQSTGPEGYAYERTFRLTRPDGMTLAYTYTGAVDLARGRSYSKVCAVRTGLCEEFVVDGRDIYRRAEGTWAKDPPLGLRSLAAGAAPFAGEVMLPTSPDDFWDLLQRSSTFISEPLADRDDLTTYRLRVNPERYLAFEPSSATFWLTRATGMLDARAWVRPDGLVARLAVMGELALRYSWEADTTFSDLDGVVRVRRPTPGTDEDAYVVA